MKDSYFHSTLKHTRQEFYEALKMAAKAAAGLEEHHREVIVAKGMENTPTLRTIASEAKKSQLHRVDVSPAVKYVLTMACTHTCCSSVYSRCTQTPTNG